MTEQELRKIEQRAERATPGPWKTYRSDYFALSYVDGQHHVGSIASLNHVNDAKFIAHAREDIPRLIAEVRRLREILRQKELRERAAAEEIDCPDCGYPLRLGRNDSLECTKPGCGYSGIPKGEFINE
jgi:hypothetical protein